MPNATFGDAEREILDLFQPGVTFVFNGERYEVKFSDKPTCRGGEPKTDIYISTQSRVGTQKEFKISFKKENADFLENKISADRAQQILGENWIEVIKKSTSTIQQQFLSKPLIYKESFGRTERGSITLGWKFELVNKQGGYLSGTIPLTREQLLDVYSGANLSIDKKNANVNGTIIANSGIANYILIYNRNSADTAQSIVDILISIEDYVNINPNIFFACKALNYRTFKQKFDGNRPLSVYINWKVENQRLKPYYIFDTPLNSC